MAETYNNRNEAQEKIQSLLSAAQTLIEQAREIAVANELSFDFGSLTFSRDENPNIDTYINWQGSYC